MVLREFDALLAGRGRLGRRASGPELRDAERAVVFIHGPADAGVWKPVMVRLPEPLACIALDLRGRGASAGLPGPYGVALNVDDVVQTMDDLGIPSAVVVSHSFGAFTATALAAQHPDRVDGLVLVAGGTPPSLGTSDGAHHELVTQWDNESVDLANGRRIDVVRDAVWADAEDIIFDPEIAGSLFAVGCPTELVQPNDPAAANAACDRNSNVSITIVPGHDERSLLLEPAGADAVAESVRRQCQMATRTSR